MSISSIVNEIEHTANGVTTIFPFPFRFLAGEDLVVSVAGALVTINVDYIVTGAGSPSGGAITFFVAPVAPSRVLIVDDPRLVQTADFVNNITVLEQNIDDALDRGILAEQATRSRINRTFRTNLTNPPVSEFNFTSSPLTIPFINASGQLILAPIATIPPETIIMSMTNIFFHAYCGGL